MGIVVKLDEDLSPLVGEPLCEAGHDVRSVAGQGWSGAKDDELWTRVLHEGALFITADKGLADVRIFPRGTHPGILLLRPDRGSLVEFRDLVAGVASQPGLKSLEGAVAVATPSGLRVRRAGVREQSANS
ncbi:MAG: DUF5615 family PIN-like protein [Phycisphaerae bacterium]